MISNGEDGGGKSENDGWILKAPEIIETTPKDYHVKLVVEKTNDYTIDATKVIFYLHDSFKKIDRSVIPDKDGKAFLEIWAFEAFTVGAVVLYKDGQRLTELELNLNDLPHAPAGFRYRSALETDSFTFKNQAPPKSFPDNNDHFYYKVFKLSETAIEIDISPLNSPYWRLGFRFSKNEDFPSLAQGRHQNNQYIDIHLCVGDRKNGIWRLPNLMELTQYHVEPVNNNFPTYKNYGGEAVMLKLSVIDDHTKIYRIEAFIGEKLIGYKDFNLSGFKFFKIAAWSDGRDFELKTEIIALDPANNSPLSS